MRCDGPSQGGIQKKTAIGTLIAMCYRALEMINGPLNLLPYAAAMTKQQVAGMVDRWLERAIAPLLAAVIIGGFIMWGDVKVIKEQMHWMRAETESASRMDAAQNASIRQLNDRLLIIETRNP